MILSTALIFVGGMALGGLVSAIYFRNTASNSGEGIPRDLYEQQLQENRRLQMRLEEHLNQSEDLKADLAASEARVEYLSKQLHNKEEELETLSERMKTTFENLANQLLEEKSQRFSQRNEQQLETLLRPLQEHLARFEQTVQSARVEDAENRTRLLEQVRLLADLNSQMSHDAKNLTRALKGDTKVQGNWGEMILERLLEKSGLVRDREYRLQSVFKQDQNRQIPDAIIYLPEDKHLIIDSKVSLIAYERYIAAESNIEQQRALKEHVQSVRQHIRELSDKNYPHIPHLKTPEFVLLFIPIEAALAVAMRLDNIDLFGEAIERNIVIVSPSTLLATMRTVAGLWRQENQNRNALEIARYGGELYDKYVGFLQDMEELGMRLRQTDYAFGAAMSKLKGKNGLSYKTQKLKTLGARNSKSITEVYLREDEELPDAPQAELFSDDGQDA